MSERRDAHAMQSVHSPKKLRLHGVCVFHSHGKMPVQRSARKKKLKKINSKNNAILSEKWSCLIVSMRTALGISFLIRWYYCNSRCLMSVFRIIWIVRRQTRYDNVTISARRNLNCRIIGPALWAQCVCVFMYAAAAAAAADECN